MAAVAKGKNRGEEIDMLMNYLKGGGGIAIEIEKRLSELPETYSVLLETDRENHELVVQNLVKIFQKENTAGIFVTVNKSAEDLLKIMKETGAKTENISIVDVVSKKQSTPSTTSKGVTCVDSPQDLNEIEAQVTDFAEAMEKAKKFFVLDSVSTLLIYNAEKNVEKFVHGLGERLRSMEFKAVFMIMKETKPEVLSVLSQFADKVIKTTPKIKP